MCLFAFMFINCTSKDDPKRLIINLKSYNKANWNFEYANIGNMSPPYSEMITPGWICYGVGINFYSNIFTKDSSNLELSIHEGIPISHGSEMQSIIQILLYPNPGNKIEKFDTINYEKSIYLNYVLVNDTVNLTSIISGKYVNIENKYFIGFRYDAMNSNQINKHLKFFKEFFKFVSIVKLDKSIPEYPDCM
ncbi:MAG: hypothetical protein ABIO44_01540 [Saprospiraceae bacterium]